MRCLWLTRVDPQPAVSGELIYSDRMIAALARAGAEITVLCLRNAGSSRRDGDFEESVRWSIDPSPPRPAWRSVASRLPNIAARCAVPTFHQRLKDMLEGHWWDVVVLDSLSTAWALPVVLERARVGRRRPRIVYISHNHEESTRSLVAREFNGKMMTAAALFVDARKAVALERRVVAAADLVTAISPADARRYGRRRDGRPVVELVPGYDGRRVARREITTEMPRRIMMVGSFHWGAKQRNLREFLDSAGAAFRDADAELTVVGDGGPFISCLRREFPSVRFTGRVPSVYPFLDHARIAVVPERLGGGFKLKTLDYIFNRLPIAALERTYEGVPLVPDESVLAYRDVAGLVRGILTALDDLPLLNGLQDRAFDACRDRFEWSDRGRLLHDSLAVIS